MIKYQKFLSNLSIYHLNYLFTKTKYFKYYFSNALLLFIPYSLLYFKYIFYFLSIILF